MSFSPFVKKSELVDISFYLYADPKIDLFIHSETEQGIKFLFDQRNESLLNISKYIKEENGDDKSTKEESNSTEDGAEPSSVENSEKINYSKIEEESSKGNDSISINDGIIQFIYKPENISEVKIKVKQPNHQEVTEMISLATILLSKESGLQIDFNRYDDIRVRTLLKSWNFKDTDENGNSINIPVNDKNISSLHPKVFNAILYYMNTKIGAYLDNYV